MKSTVSNHLRHLHVRFALIYWRFTNDILNCYNKSCRVIFSYRIVSFVNFLTHSLLLTYMLCRLSYNKYNIALI